MATTERTGIRWIRHAAYAVILAAIGWAYVTLAQQRIRDDSGRRLDRIEIRHLAVARETQSDLKLDFSRSVSEPLQRWLPHRTDGVVQPLWPWVSAWAGLPTDTAAADAVVGAGWLQMGLSLGFLLVLGMALGRSFSLPAAVLVILQMGLYGFLPTVGSFTGDALFQILFLLTWVTCVYGTQRNSLWVYGLAGGVGALAYLTDERVLPLLVVFVIVSTLRAVWEWLAAHWPRQLGASTSLWVPRNHLLGGMLMAGLFLFISAPRLVESHRQFGASFFHFQDRVRWLDDAQSAWAWIEEHDDSSRLLAMTKAEMPSLANYRLEHPDGIAWNRLRDGTVRVLAAFAKEGGAALALLLVVLLGMTALMPVATGKVVHAGQRLHPETVPAVFFVVLTAAVYVVVAAWDAPITGAAGRLRLLQPSLVLGALWGCESLLRRARRRQAPKAFAVAYKTLLWHLILLGCWDVIQRLQSAPTAP